MKTAAGAFSLVAEEGWRGANIEAVCRRAALNKRYFYESFEGVDVLISAVTTWLADDAIEVTLAALDPELPRDESTTHAIAAFVEHLTDDPRRARVPFGAVPADDAAARLRAAAIRRPSAPQAVHAFLLALPDELPYHPVARRGRATYRETGEARRCPYRGRRRISAERRGAIRS